MSINEPKEILLALVNAVEGREEEFNQWYSGEHIPEILELPGFVRAQRYEVADDPAAAAGFRYATVYEIEGSAIEARKQLFTGALGSSDALESSQIVMAAFTPRGEPFEK